ncbi:hypothetical protein EYF80_002889 [Liparis tanakae]|uniref:Uncharacterized protein n=1 Tax=Liparis tanakae TaxID=230148 RepID=A0A4Z2J910_9TELE|nr:hypothetical protein EYF80_002889 [Liparis tanakae]
MDAFDEMERWFAQGDFLGCTTTCSPRQIGPTDEYIAGAPLSLWDSIAAVKGLDTEPSDIRVLGHMERMQLEAAGVATVQQGIGPAEERRRGEEEERRIEGKEGERGREGKWGGLMGRKVGAVLLEVNECSDGVTVPPVVTSHFRRVYILKPCQARDRSSPVLQVLPEHGKILAKSKRTTVTQSDCVSARRLARSDIYHFGVEVFDILRVEDGHERLGAHGLAADLLSHHERHVLWVVVKVVDERLALASYGLRHKHTSQNALLAAGRVQRRE